MKTVGVADGYSKGAAWPFCQIERVTGENEMGVSQVFRIRKTGTCGDDRLAPASKRSDFEPWKEKEKKDEKRVATFREWVIRRGRTKQCDQRIDKANRLRQK